MNMNAKTTYIALAIVFFASVLLLFLVPFGGGIPMLAEIPAIGSLCFALYQIGRDRIAHERSRLLLETQNSFSMGAASHMANVAFDRHVTFCEEYVSEMFNCLTTLLREGPTKNALLHATNLYRIQTKWAIWITPEVAKELDRFESAIRKIGAKAKLLESCPEQSAAIKEMYVLFSEVMAEELGVAEWDGIAISGDLAVTAVIGKLRAVLGIAELTSLRTRLVARAMDTLKNR